MCNSKLEHRISIEKTGHGWKLFRKNEGGLIGAMIHVKYTNMNKSNGFIRWKSSHYQNEAYDDGFCFFLTRRKARARKRCLPHMTLTIRKIEYKGGIGKDSDGVGLCREFHIIEGVYG